MDKHTLHTGRCSGENLLEGCGVREGITGEVTCELRRNAKTGAEPSWKRKQQVQRKAQKLEQGWQS